MNVMKIIMIITKSLTSGKYGSPNNKETLRLGFSAQVCFLNIQVLVLKNN